MIIFAVTSLVATILRIIPSIISSSSNPHFSSIAVPFLHIGQILNALCAPLVQVPVSQLSCIWFAPNERARATTFALMINNFGAAVGFLISPLIVDIPEHVPHLLYVHLSFAFIACVLTLIYFPSYPPTPPSPAAERLLSYSLSDNSINSLRVFMKDLWQCMKSPPFMLLSIVGGLTTGAFSAWTGLYDVILAPENYTEVQAGKMIMIIR
jgi:Na+/melibiose symporter-like transporter